jgi:hypothetical protein
MAIDFENPGALPQAEVNARLRRFISGTPGIKEALQSQ